jgi:hypothetical protein
LADYGLSGSSSQTDFNGGSRWLSTSFERFRLRAIRQTSMRGWAVARRPAGRSIVVVAQIAAPVREQRVVGTAAVAEMLVDVYNRLARAGLRRLP